MSVLYVDIETLPQAEPVDPSEVDAPANYKDPEKIIAYQREHAAEAWAKTALKPLSGQIACIAWALDDAPVRSAWALNDLGAALDAVADDLDAAGGWPLWCGHNVAGFDLVYLKLHALRIKHRIASVIPYAKWDKRVIDTMDLFGGPNPGANKMGQAALARFFGLPVTTRPGSEVLPLYLAGDTDRILAHCVEDVEIVRELHRRIR